MAPSITNYAEIQNDEIEVLRSIYMDDFVEEKPKAGAWNRTADRSFTIGLKTILGGEDKLALRLHVSFPSTYPKTYPHLRLNFDDNVRQKTRKQLSAIVQDVPKKLEPGAEMIYEIATLLQEELDNASRIIAMDVPTLDEERTLREAALLKEQEEESLRQTEAKRTKEADGLEEEQRLLKELVEQEKSRSTQRKAAKASDPPDHANLSKTIRGIVHFDQSSSVKDRRGKIVEVKSCFDKVLHRTGPIANTFTVQIQSENLEPIASTEDSIASHGPFLILKEYLVSSAASNDGTRKAIQNLEANLDQQTHRLPPHPNIVKPINYLILRSDLQDESSLPSSWTISILTELAMKGSLLELLEMAGQISDTRKIRGWALQVLEGLHHYHRQGLAHGSLHLSNILLDHGEAKNIVARLSDGCYGHALHRLKEQPLKGVPLSWKVPEDIQNEEKVSITADIWDFGTCLLQMGFGVEFVHEYDSPMAALGDLNFTGSFRALLSQIFAVDPKRRPSAWDVLHFEFFRSDDGLLEHRLEDLSTRRHFSTDGPTLNMRHPRRESIAGTATSRYAKEFVEDGRLGRGGFGEVFRARNRVDGQLYAIKKIKARSRAALDPVLSEASVLSRLNHPNVVRYFASWIDDAVNTEIESEIESSAEALSSSLSRFAPDPVLPLSSRGLDFISSNNAHVVFGNDADDTVDFGDGDASNSHDQGLVDDDIEEDEDDEESPSDSSEDSDFLESGNPGQDTPNKSSNRVLQIRRERRMSGQQRLSERQSWALLYIQMEYCRPETLRNLINTGIQSDPSEGFRLLRQIVQGLAHIHAASIVHRDLKPENVFIDANGDVRIGDFGLARPGDYRKIDHNGTRNGETLGSFTKDIGTASYVAPEVQSAGGGKYNEKADIYSLGVVFLEMNVIFATGMERAESLAALQISEPVLPPMLEHAERATQRVIVRSLTQRDPSLRPSSLDLLNSGQIPVQDEDETLRMARRLVGDPKSHLRHEFLESLFSSQSPTEQGHNDGSQKQGAYQKLELLEDVLAMSRSQPDDLELQTLVKDRLTAIFSRHGAIERTDNPAIFPYQSCYSAPEVLRFISPSGSLLQLPYDLVLPNAMLLARAVNVDRKRTFVFDNVYRIDPTMRKPRIFGEANFDIISGGGSTNLVIHEAEALKCIDEILDTFPNLASARMCYHINHSHLLNFILSFCEIHQGKWPAVKEIMSKINTGDWTWAKVRHELRAPPTSIPGTCLDELERFDFRDSTGKAILRLRSLLQNTAGLETTFDQLNTVAGCLDGFGIKRKVYLNPLSSYNEKFYSGNLLFQSLFDQKRRSVFAAGGRYDHLIRQHQPITTKDNRVHAVGFQLTWTGLTMGMMNHLKAQAKSKSKRKLREVDKGAWNRRRCDVLVDSFDRSLLSTVGIGILNELWANDMSAELVESYYGMSNDYVRSNENKESYGWIVFAKSEDTLKVKNNARKDEIEIRLSELSAHLRGEIRERDREEGRTTMNKTSLHRHTSHIEQSGNDKTQEPEVKIIVSQVKTKKANRKTLVEEARTRAREWRVDTQDCPVIAVELKENVFEYLEETNIHDPETWKRFVQDIAPQDRQYLSQIQSTLENVDASAVFIYNYRTKQIMHYHVGNRPDKKT